MFTTKRENTKRLQKIEYKNRRTEYILTKIKQNNNKHLSNFDTNNQE